MGSSTEEDDELRAKIEHVKLEVLKPLSPSNMRSRVAMGVVSYAARSWKNAFKCFQNGLDLKNVWRAQNDFNMFLKFVEDVLVCCRHLKQLTAFLESIFEGASTTFVTYSSLDKGALTLLTNRFN